MIVYVVESSWGEYSDSGQKVEGVYLNRDTAIEWITSQAIVVYQDNDEWYASCDDEWYDMDAPHKLITPVFNGDFERPVFTYECIYNLDTPSYRILELELVERLCRVAKVYNQQGITAMYETRVVDMECGGYFILHDMSEMPPCCPCCGAKVVE